MSISPLGFCHLRNETSNSVGGGELRAQLSCC